MACDKQGNILVTDAGTHCVQKFTAEGYFLSSFGDGRLQFNIPGGIAFNGSNNKVYVVDTGNSRVQVLNPDFTFFSQFGMKGSSLCSPPI